jgi:hypothetical protein
LQSLKEQCTSLLADGLISLGWKRAARNRDLFYSPVPEVLVPQFQANGTVDRFGGSVTFLPTLGVRHPEASDLETRFLGLSVKDNRFVAIHGCGLVDLLPEIDPRLATRWRASSQETATETASRILDDFSRYGLPFYGEFSDVTDVIRYLNSLDRSQEQNGKLAILNAISGYYPEALVALGDYADIARSQSPPISVQSENFVKSFVEHFGLGESLLLNSLD